MLLINLYGSPGAGKSTCAAYIFSQIKLKQINAELVTEFAKDLVWEENFKALTNQAYVLGNQCYRLSRLKDKTDVVITDSPIMLSTIYVDKKYEPEFTDFVKKVHQDYVSLNYFIIREKPYNPIGRMQTEEESDIISIQTKKMLQDNDIKFKTIKGNIKGFDTIVADIIDKIKK